MTTWGWPDKGKKAHAFDKNGRALCGRAIMVEEVENPAPGDRCANCKKESAKHDLAEAREAARGGPFPLMRMLVMPPPGDVLVCPSTVHLPGPPVRANWEGVFIDPELQEHAAAAYCDWCAHMLATTFRFVMETDPPLCVRCHGAYAVPQHDPCCTGDAPHGRPLCCHCYGETHHVVGVPCH